MPRKQTSSRISTIAAKYMNDDSVIDVDAIATAVRECGIPLNDRAVLALTNKIESAIAPMITDLRSLAASALSQDESKGNWGEGSSGGDNGDETGAQGMGSPA